MRPSSLFGTKPPLEKIMSSLAHFQRLGILTCAGLLAACSSTGGGSASTGGHGGQTNQTGSGGAVATGTGSVAGANGGTGSGGTPGNDESGGVTGSGGAPVGTGGGQDSGSGGSPNAAGSGGQAGSGTAGSGTAGSGPVGGATGSAGTTGGGQPDGGTVISNCVGKMVPTADPTKMGPFEVTSDKGVGPVAGEPGDPIYGDTPLHFNVYRPKDLAGGGYCFPIIIWSNGHQDNPERVTSPGTNCPGTCGRYLPLMQQLASHGFVVVASLSSQTSKGNPLPSIVGLDWILKQADDATSPYYHHLDTAHIGASGHSEGGFTSCKMASDPRFSAISTVAGSQMNPGFHQP
ncbi:MAG: hypothetical protein ABIS92_03615, partial [Polyangia bacterium]